MSFSGDVKDELSRHVPKSRHCCMAELAAAIALSGDITKEKTGFHICIHTENTAVARKYFTLLKKTFNINTDISVRETDYPRKSRLCELHVSDNDKAVEILRSLKLLDAEGDLSEATHTVNGLLIQKTCCRRAFIRGAFLSSGSVSDPEKSYHFEVVCDYEDQAKELKGVINGFGLESKMIRRKNSYVVYIKESAQIVEILNIMEAHVALMELENVRILKSMRNTVNRKVNCETANLNKVVSAAVKQSDDIRLIDEMLGLESLPEGLEQVARLRLENPELPLKELGELLNPPVGKSGVNHRLRKISEIADGLR
ncbi:MAG: DNA-binding protein WhiA [Lachnospiraceae bacterium]|nr:DNA-binding protein WhiA [Lachnospiraceae bacterium]